MGRLFWKFFFAFWLALIVAALVAGATVWLRHHDKEEQLSTLDSHATAFILVAEERFQQGGKPALIRYLHSLRDKFAPTIYVVNEQNKDILNRPVSQDLIQAARTQLLIPGTLKPVIQLTDESEQKYLLFSPPIPHRKHKKVDFESLDHISPALREKIASLPPELAPLTRSRLQKFSLFSLITIGATSSLLFSFLLAWYFTRPIRTLREAFSKVAKGQLDTRVGVNMHFSNDELTELGLQFDEMTTQIQALVGGQQRLLHDVSHELRSPLARMQAAIGIAQQQPEKVNDTLDRLEKEAQRISDLVGELLLLSKLETGVTERENVEVDLSELISNIVEDARFEAKSKQIEINYQPPVELLVLGQYPLLQRAIENVLRNAIKFSEPFTLISVEIEFDTPNNALLIHIKDQGPGVDEVLLETIFKPFYKGNHHRVNDSVGLGLTIASRAIESHGGFITARNRPNGGLQVTLSLPADLVIQS